MEDYRDALAELMLKRGSILHSEELFKESIGHGKFFIIIGEDANNIKGYFYINSNINEFIKSKPKMAELQYAISETDYPFLKYHSFVNCASLVDIPKKALIEGIKDGKIESRGEMLTRDMDSILESVRKSDLYSPEQKQTYFK